MSRAWDHDRRLRQLGDRNVAASVGDPVSMFAVHGNPVLCEHPGPRRHLAAVPSSLER